MTDDDIIESILDAVRRIDLGAGWKALGPLVLPTLKRVDHPYPPECAPLLIQVPPGIWTGFGIDLGPAFTHVTASQLSAWGVDRSTIFATALDNLRRLSTTERPDVQTIALGETDLLAICGQGWGSALLLVPEVLGPILGPDPMLLMAPVRNTILAIPEGVGVDVVVGLWQAVADGAHDELDVDPVRWTGSAIVALGDQGRGLPN